MRNILIITLISVFVGSISAQKWGCVYPLKRTVVTSQIHSAITINADTIKTVDDSFWFGPSIALDVFTKDNATGKYSLGVIPGVGYGIKWNPPIMQKYKKNYLLGVDLFASAALDQAINPTDPSYFVVKLTPVVTILGWVHFGYGPTWNIGVNGAKNRLSSMLVIGVTQSL
jgi:hypothetical protein